MGRWLPGAWATCCTTSAAAYGRLFAQIDRGPDAVLHREPGLSHKLFARLTRYTREMALSHRSASGVPVSRLIADPTSGTRNMQ
jgi:hypothetical protein